MFFFNAEFQQQSIFSFIECDPKMSVDTIPNNISNSESTTIHLEYSAAQSPITQEKLSSPSNESETQYVSQTELLSPGSSHSLFFDQSSLLSQANVTQLCVDANSLILHEDSEQEEVIEDLDLDNTITQAEEQKDERESDEQPFVSTDAKEENEEENQQHVQKESEDNCDETTEIHYENDFDGSSICTGQAPLGDEEMSQDDSESRDLDLHENEEDDMDDVQRKWLDEISSGAEMETLSILYAKSILDPAVSNGLGTRVAIGCKEPSDARSLDKNLSKYVQMPSINRKSEAAAASPPAKPSRCIARLLPTHIPGSTHTTNPHYSGLSSSMYASVPSTKPKLSTEPRNRDCSSLATTSVMSSSLYQNNSTTIYLPPSKYSCQNVKNGGYTNPLSKTVVIRAPRIIDENIRPSTSKLRFASSLPNGHGLTDSLTTHSQDSEESCLHSQAASSASTTDGEINDYSQLPLCNDSQWQPTKQPISAVYEPKIEYRTDRRSRCKIPRMSCVPPTLFACSQSKETKPVPRKINSSSPKSTDSVGSSQDSGQCSGGPDNSPPSSNCRPSEKSFLPGYVRMASTMDHILRTSSAIFSLLNANPRDERISRELHQKVNHYIRIIRQSPCANQAIESDIELVVCAIRDAERDASMKGCPLQLSDYTAIVIRKMLEQSMIIFVRIICNYLFDCVNKDHLLVVALEHLIHLLLFDDESVKLEAIKGNAVDNIIEFCRMASTPSGTQQLLLRNLAVLCGTSRGCLQLLSIDGFDVIMHILCESRFECSVEAAGVLTQLTNPRHSFVKLNISLRTCLLRLLGLVDECANSESFLLCTAAISNLSLQNSNAAVDLLYQHNAVLRLIQTLNRPHCANLFVQEQIVTIFSRLAIRGYEQALIAQGAIPVLLQMLTVVDAKKPAQGEFCKRIRYQAAACLGTISASGIGLKAIYENRGYNELCEALRAEGYKPSPLVFICSSIKQQLETTYQVETSV
ncbi:CRE-INSC-1 protein [Ditylenchus destructor]|nr:CRE-INSC-1 protein [Ditylenchus destructor]